MKTNRRGNLFHLLLLITVVLLGRDHRVYSAQISKSANRDAANGLCAFDRYVEGKPFNVGNQWVFLGDDYYVEDKNGVKRVMAHVTKIPTNPVLIPSPWEDYISWPIVIYDNKTKMYDMWYQAWNSTAWWDEVNVAPNTGEYALAKGGSQKHAYPYWIAFARSYDGIHWEKPRLDLYPYLSFAKTNIVMVGETEAEAPWVWLNDDQSDPARRFLMVYSDRLKDPSKGQSLMLAYSADGIHWQVDKTVSPLLTHVPDGIFQPIFQKDHDRWLLFRRPFYTGAAVIPKGRYAAVRPNGRITVSVNSRLGPGWTYPRIVLVPEEGERRDIDTMHVFREGTHYIATLGMMDDEKGGLQDAHLASSPDGLTWTKYPFLPPLIPLGKKGSFDAGIVGPPYVLDQGEFTYLYYAADIVGQRVQQGYYSSIGFARMRRGRWIGLASDINGGYMLTRELVVSGNRLELNYQGIEAPFMHPINGNPQGYIQAELLRRASSGVTLEPIPGFTMEESDRYFGDSQNRVATWKGKWDLSGLRGTSIFIRFHIVQSELWGFRFEK